MKYIIAITLILALFLVSCSVDDSSTDVRSFVFDWSDGSCQHDPDCTAFDFGCGGGHIQCTNDTSKWEGTFSTCEIVENHPSQEGRICSCDAKEHKCGWAK